MAQVAISDTGSASTGMSVARTDLRKAKMTRITRHAASIKVNSTSETALRMETERSLVTSSDIADGICLR